MGSERVCACGKKVSSMRRSDWCSSICKRQHDYEKRKVKLKGAQVTVFTLVHRCIRPEFQMGETPDPLTCRCREEMSEKKIKECVRRGEIVLVGPEGHACYSSKLRRAPRAQTVEKAHIERSLTSLGADGRTLASLRAAVEEDKLSREEEEQQRIDIFHEIEIEERLKLIREVPAVAYDRIKNDQFGRMWLGQPGQKDRDEGSIGKDVRIPATAPNAEA